MKMRDHGDIISEEGEEREFATLAPANDQTEEQRGRQIDGHGMEATLVCVHSEKGLM